MTLEPCPFCGGEAETRNSRWNGRDHWGVICTDCGDPWFDCRGDFEAEAIAAWNTRAPDPRIAALTAEVARKDEALLIARTAFAGYADSKAQSEAIDIITAALEARNAETEDRRPIAIYHNADLEAYYSATREQQDAWNSYANAAAEAFNETCDSYDSTNTYCGFNRDKEVTPWCPPMFFPEWLKKYND